MPVLVIGIVRSSHPDPADPLRLVRADPIAAAVRDIEDENELGEPDAVQYFEDLAALLRAGPVLPVRFGTVAENDEAVIDGMHELAGDHAAERLDALEGLVEVRLRVEPGRAMANQGRAMERLAVAHVGIAIDDTLELDAFAHAYLIHEQDLAAFDDEVRKVRAALPETCAMEYVGPLPPFEFVEQELAPRKPAPSRWGF